MPDRMVLMDRSYDSSLLSGGEPLDLRNIDAGAFRAILERCRSERLRMYHMTIADLSGIEALRSVSDLALEWAPKVTSIAPVLAMKWLHRLTLVDLPKIRDFEGLGALANLRQLEASGGVWRPLRIASISPISGLNSLEHLTLQQIRIEDDNISKLADLKGLRRLVLSNQFERAQVAYLAKRLNPQLEAPLTAHVETNLACERCGSVKFMFTGRRMPFLCRACDFARFEKLTQEFATLENAV